MAAKDLYEKDLYTILGVKKSDSDDVIKKQYRKLSKELHPDATKGDKKLEERFKEVSEAYEVLSDPKKRAEYNEMRDLYKSGGMRGGMGGMGGGPQGGYQDFFGGGDPQDIFSTLFGGGHRGPRRGQDLQTETTISFRNAFFGTEINANGTTTRIPAGIKDGAKIKLAGRGAPGQGGNGDLYIIVHVTKHPVFRREELNLHMDLPVTFTEAALGADVKVPTMDGDEVTVRIAPSTPSGRTLRVKGRGVKTTKGQGDLLVTIVVAVPQRVDGKAKEALEQFAEATNDFNPRADLSQRAKA